MSCYCYCCVVPKQSVCVCGVQSDFDFIAAVTVADIFFIIIVVVDADSNFFVVAVIDHLFGAAATTTNCSSVTSADWFAAVKLSLYVCMWGCVCLRLFVVAATAKRQH